MWGIRLNRESELPLKRQIYQGLKELIINGQVISGEVLPSTREMAKNLDISRNTVCEAYEMLFAEGFITSHQGAPTRVADDVAVKKTAPVPIKQDNSTHSISVSFQTGQPDLRYFPRGFWQKLLLSASEAMPVEKYGYTSPQGLIELRTEIAGWLLRSRGLNLDPEDIFITAGSTHALHIIAAMLCTQGRKIIIEDPCHRGMLQTFINNGCPIIPVPVDEQGLQPQLLTADNSAGAIYVTPSHQFPLGGILPASRRAALIRFAQENDLYIIEDDYDSEFRYGGEAIAPLHSMDPARVIYVGTFSKVVFPALRIGYVILPGGLHKRWNRLRTYTDIQNPPLEQAALAQFLQTRKLDRHVKKMRKIYGERRQELLNSLEEVFGTELTAFGDAAGLHVAIDFPGKQFDEEFRRSCLQKGIYINPVESYCIRKGYHQSKLLMGYGHLEPEEIRQGIKQFYDFCLGYQG